MGWDVDLVADTGGPDMAYLHGCEWDYTYNTSAMLREAGIEMTDWKDKQVCEVLPTFREGVARLKADPAKYEAMNPPNGWGSYEGVLGVMEKMLMTFEQHPKAYIRACL